MHRKKKKKHEIVKDKPRCNKLKHCKGENWFQCNNAPDYNIEPYDPMFPTVAWRDLVELSSLM